MKNSVIRNHLAAVVLGSSLVAASSFAQTSMLSSEAVGTTDLTQPQFVHPDEVAAAPILVAVIAVASLVSASETMVHYQPESLPRIEANQIERSMQNGNIEALFDP